VFTDPRVLKVAHGTFNDILWLQRDLGVYVVNLFDTHEAAVLLDLPRRSLAHLLYAYCGVSADKQYQLADWRMRPLKEEMVTYARMDTRYLEYLYWRLRGQLVEMGGNYLR
jgi:exosome complex exonuclease RRP6